MPQRPPYLGVVVRFSFGRILGDGSARFGSVEVNLMVFFKGKSSGLEKHWCVGAIL